MPAEILHSARLPWPTNWSALFQRDAPLVMEIGFGNGEFLLHSARQHPEWNWIGVEISLPSLRKAAKKVATAELKHVRIVQGDALIVLWALCQPQSVAGLYVNFPDPWPKIDHVHRRLINDEFLTLAATRLQPGGFLDIATDHPDYQPWVAAHLARTPYFESRLSTPFATTDPGRLVTKYEEKGLREGRPPHYFKWRRNGRSAPAAFAIPKEFDMPHVVFESPLSLDEIAARFVPLETAVGDIRVRMSDMLKSVLEPTLMVETYVMERPLSQRVGLFIRRRQTGDYVVGLHEVGFPRPTYGIQIAVHHLASWLQSLHPDMTVTRSTLKMTLDDTAE